MSRPIELIFEKRAELKQKLEEIREMRKKGGKRFQKPCIYVAMVTQPPASHANPNPECNAVVQVINVQGGRNKAATVTNMLRRGQYPIGYDFPSDETFRQWKSAAQNSNAMVSGDIAKYLATGEDPWASLRFILDEQIKVTLQTWQAADYKHESELEKKMLAEENAQLKEELLKLGGLKSDKGVKAKEAEKPKKEEVDPDAESVEDLKAELEKSKNK